MMVTLKLDHVRLVRLHRRGLGLLPARDEPEEVARHDRGVRIIQTWSGFRFLPEKTNKYLKSFQNMK